MRSEYDTIGRMTIKYFFLKVRIREDNEICHLGFGRNSIHYYKDVDIFEENSLPSLFI